MVMVMGMTECEASPVPVWEGRHRAEAALVSRGTATHPVASDKQCEKFGENLIWCLHPEVATATLTECLWQTSTNLLIVDRDQAKGILPESGEQAQVDARPEPRSEQFGLHWQPTARHSKDSALVFSRGPHHDVDGASE